MRIHGGAGREGGAAGAKMGRAANDGGRGVRRRRSARRGEARAFPGLRPGYLRLDPEKVDRVLPWQTKTLLYTLSSIWRSVLPSTR